MRKLVLALILLAACRTEYKKAAVPETTVPQPIAVQGQEVGAAQNQVSYYSFSGRHDASKQALDVAHNTEEYGQFEENPFLRPADNPLSTFSIDVDRASYANVRRFLRDGNRPPRQAVRIEEMINYFTYDYPEPGVGAPVSITTELAACPWNEKNRLLLVGLQTQKIHTEDLPPNNLVFLVDTSGSMMSADKLPLVKSALRLLVDQLRPEDRVSIVAYAGSAGLVLKPTKGSDRGVILEAIDAFEAGGSTAGAEGIVLAYQVAKDNFVRDGNNRVVLATDGDFNVGVSSDGELEQLIEKKRRDGIFLTVLGFGSGNLKDSKMELLADKGNGNYSYIDTIAEARKSLVREMGATLFTVAKDVKIQVEFNPATVGAYRLIGYENRLLRSEDFNNDAKDAGELGAGHSVTALYEIVPPGGDVPNANVDPLKYQSRTASAGGTDLATVKLRYKEPQGDTSKLMTSIVSTATAAVPSENFKLASSVAQLGMLLRDSPHKGNATFESIPRIEAEDFPEIVAMARSLEAPKSAGL
ncbi:MAG TPA: VWA domain-containing protein [Thermoanaerobaculia bacterium]|jgi:Ca-activated chloride channel family protein|nr:VWA domain-containing protein [Thermoanaerobaculia bacterium]